MDTRRRPAALFTAALCAYTGSVTIGGTLAVTGNLTISNPSNLFFASGIGMHWDGSEIASTGRFTAPNITAGQSNNPVYGGAVTPWLGYNLGTMTGTITGQGDMARFAVASDAVNCSAASNGLCDMLGLYSNIAATAGGRAMLQSIMNVGVLSTNSTEMIGLNSQISTSGNINGAFLQALASSVFALSAATSVGNIINEFDYGSAASIGVKGGLQITLLAGDTTAGGATDAGVIFSSGGLHGGTSPGMTHGISFGNAAQGWPINSTSGDLVGVTLQITNGGSNKNAQFLPVQVLNGDNYSSIYFTGSSFLAPGFGVSGQDVLSLGQLLVTPGSAGVSLDIPAERLTAATVSNGGTGSGGIGCYYVGDIVQDVYGDVLSVATVSGCAAATFTILVHGATASPPGSAVAMSGGSGTGLTATLTFGTARLLALQGSGGGLSINGVTAVSCAANSVSLLTEVVTNGIVTHC